VCDFSVHFWSYRIGYAASVTVWLYPHQVAHVFILFYFLKLRIFNKGEGAMMKRLAVLLFLVWLIPAGMVWAESPVVVSHVMTGYDRGAESVVLNYTLTVKNSGNSGLTNLTLSHVPLFIISKDRATLNIGNLGPQAEIQVSFTLTTPMLLSESEFKSQPIFWAGECMDASGNFIEFPAKSNERGAI